MPENESIAVRVFDKNDIVIEKEIGSGSFGKVFKGSTLDGRLSVAVKVFRKELKNGCVTQREKDTAYEELLKVAVIHHENIVKLHGMIQDGASELPSLIFEYMKDGNLLEYVIKNENIKEKTLLRFCKDICCGMAFLHDNKILHKDLAARNILLNNKTAKIADLGLSSFLTNDDGDIYSLNGKLFPYRHAAIECIVEQVYTFESDVWSFGVLMHEIFNGGKTPYGKDYKQPDVRRFIVEGLSPLYFSEPHCSMKIITLMKKILNPAMRERPTFQYLHKKFQKYATGTMMGMDFRSNENLLSANKDTSAALSAFHKIKANGLSASINNLQVSTSNTSHGSTTRVLLASNIEPHKESHLTPTSHFEKQYGNLAVADIASRSSSTPDLVSAMGASANTMQMFANNFLSVMPAQTNSEKRHSIGMSRLDAELPLPLLRRSSEVRHATEMPFSQSASPQQIGEYLDEPRARANSSSKAMKNPLLEGFVKNRFRKS